MARAEVRGDKGHGTGQEQQQVREQLKEKGGREGHILRNNMCIPALGCWWHR